MVLPRKIEYDSDSLPSNKQAVSTPPSGKSQHSAAERVPFRVISVVDDDEALNEGQIRLLLRDLRSSTSLEQAEDAMAALRQPLAAKTPDGIGHQVKIATAETIAKANGTAAILMALTDWQSQDFVNLALRALIQITCFVSKSRNFVVESGGVRTILASATLHPGDYPVIASAMGLLSNLSLDKSTCLDLATKDCIDFVVEAMQCWPDDAYTQRCGCVYFNNVCALEDAQTMLHKKRVGILLASVVENFYFYDTEGETFQAAKDALATYLSCE